MKNGTKSKRKEIEAPIYEISLNFTNNLFQTYLFELFEKLKIDIQPSQLIYEEITFSNLIKITYKSEIFLLTFFDKNITELLKNNNLFQIIEKYLKLTQPNNITLFFYGLNEGNFKEKNELVFFLNTEIKVNIIDCNTTNELIDYMQNYIESIIKKEEKSKITFFDSKPVACTSLCEMENITEADSLTWVKHLMCIPGISEIKAISIVKQYPTFNSLMAIYDSHEYTENEKENILRDVEIENKTKNTKKRLGNALSAKIYKMFYSNDPNIIIN